MNKNPSIRCDIHSCQHNMNSEDYCTLESIKVGTHEPHPKMPECTDCQSFIMRSGS
ncbi:MAG: DUF1540 domain-containing protein [Oscillospiraceae bacterium]|nr:DUF1540 domain-containing protein [Oscillospiraceae bacterium]